MLGRDLPNTGSDVLENQIFFHSRASLLSHQRHKCHNFSIFGQYIKIFLKKVQFSFTFSLVIFGPMIYTAPYVMVF